MRVITIMLAIAASLPIRATAATVYEADLHIPGIPEQFIGGIHTGTAHVSQIGPALDFDIWIRTPFGSAPESPVAQITIGDGVFTTALDVSYLGIFQITGAQSPVNPFLPPSPLNQNPFQNTAPSIATYHRFAATASVHPDFDISSAILTVEQESSSPSFGELNVIPEPSAALYALLGSLLFFTQRRVNKRLHDNP